ncbi:DNA-dependent RNA polymerase subunit epsilon [Bacillus norwichensis]|uniref:DNA-directed RNA polymerase subunit epsilon n=1 Tax=Bacillus norwichensis TaxID=2762217 RepID=A0ABR8VRL4_9BACI|nr:DNA-directed RNA polymerase subunit epsilon [Bacillus norwichensis]MBD8007395.1 DNA-dependent RNA polymerase auxiliary subunit epsilon family protein [Bacillus norwichensis]
MIYKVYYQESLLEMPVRENTKVLFIEAESELDVRRHLKDRQINLEFIQLLEGPYLEYEKNSPNFTLETI